MNQTKEKCPGTAATVQSTNPKNHLHNTIPSGETQVPDEEKRLRDAVIELEGDLAVIRCLAERGRAAQQRVTDKYFGDLEVAQGGWIAGYAFQETGIFAEIAHDYLRMIEEKVEEILTLLEVSK